MTHYFVLLDVGSTSIKSALVESGNTRLQSINVINTPDMITSSPHIKEIDPQTLLDACSEVLDGIASQNHTYLGLIITGQMGGWILTDIHDKPITNVVSWQDSRSLRPNSRGIVSFNYFQDLLKENLVSANGQEFRSGLPILGIHSTLKDLSNIGHHQRFHSIISWIGSQLCADYNFIAHTTDVAASGFFNIWDHTWFPNTNEILGTNLELPSSVDAMSIIGYNKLLNCPVFTPVGDQQSSLYGIELAKNQIAMNIGTGGQIAMLADKLKATSMQQRPYFSGKFIVTKTHLPGGRAIAAFLKVIIGRTPKEKDFKWMNDQFETNLHFTPVNVENFELEILQNYDLFKENPDIFASNILKSVSNKYLEEIIKFKLNSEYEIVVAGGIGGRLNNVAKYVAKELNLNVRFSSTEETTLQGLANLTSLINKS